MTESGSDRVRSGYRWARKRAKRAQSHVWLAWLKAVNRRSRAAVLGTADVVVSLTTFGPRLDSVAYTIESIAAGIRFFFAGKAVEVVPLDGVDESARFALRWNEVVPPAGGHVRAVRHTRQTCRDGI